MLVKENRFSRPQLAGYSAETMRNKASRISLAVAAIVIFIGSASLARAESPKLVWKGCSITKQAFMGECVAAYERKTGVHIELIGGGATLGIRATLEGDADLGGTCRPCRPDIFPGVESGGCLVHVAWDAICFITHPDNPVSGITSQQAKDILTGRITNWRQVGGPDRPILLIYRRQTERGKFSGVGYMTRKLLFKDNDVDFSRKALNFRDSGLVERKVEELRWSFAPDGISSAQRRNVKVLAIDDTVCSKENIMSGRYPFFRPLYLITRGKPAGEVKKIIDWILGEEGQAIIGSQGTVNLVEGRFLSGKFDAWEQRELILNVGDTAEPGTRNP